MVVNTLGKVAEHFGVAERTVGTWKNTRGMPVEPDSTYDLEKIGKWKREREARRLVPDDDPLMVEGESPALERYREARAKLAELELAKKKGEVIEVEIMRPGLDRLVASFRSLGGKLRERFGDGAYEIYCEALDLAQLEIDRFFDDDDTDEARTPRADGASAAGEGPPVSDDPAVC